LKYFFIFLSRIFKAGLAEKAAVLHMRKMIYIIIDKI